MDMIKGVRLDVSHPIVSFGQGGTALTNVWIGHIIAGILGVLLSLSVVFQGLERVFAVHRKLRNEDIEKIMSETGAEMSRDERVAFVEWYNRLVYIGKNAHPIKGYDLGTSVYFHSGERIQIILGEKFYEVRRIRKNGKVVHFELLDKR